MKIHYIFILFLLISCQKQQNVAQRSNALTENKKDTTTEEKTFLKTDTISIFENGERSKKNYILANLLEQKADKDSIVTVKYQLDFYQNKTKVTSDKITIEGFQEGSAWSASTRIDDEDLKNYSFINLSFGVEACGYNQNNYLYYLNNNELQLVHQWDSMSDSGWGNWVEFVTPNKKGETQLFYCKTVSFSPTDDNNEDTGIVSYSDSTSFKFNGNRWEKQLLSQKGKSYFEKKISFDDFHNQK